MSLILKHNIMQKRPRRKLLEIFSNKQGLAMTEFALILPVLMTMSIGFIELASYIHAHMRVSQIALSVADNAGRITQTIDITDVDATMIGARLAGESIKFGQNGRVILSMIERNGETVPSKVGQQISWQRCFGLKNVTSSYGAALAGDTDATYAQGFGPANRRIASTTTDDGVMMVEVFYDYAPIFPVNNSLIRGLRGSQIRAVAAYPVRDRNSNNLLNGFNLTASDPRHRLCTTFSAT
jgi:hypothetical protein